MSFQSKPTLLLPVELQVRELEPKLLLASVAVRNGYTAVIGPRRELHFQIPRFRHCIYISKSTTKASRSVFRTLDQLGNKIVVWDEEALVSLPPELYFRHRLHSQAMRYVSRFFAWGEANATLWQNYPEFPKSIPVHVTGNPRGDLLRPELREFYQEPVAALRDKYGDFVLVNSNFNHVNAYYTDMCLVTDGRNPGDKPILSRRAISLGLTRDYAIDFSAYKRQILEDFKRMVPTLEKAIPEINIVLRPHPAENPEVYHQIASDCRRVKVTNEGNVVPWLLAAKALIHNGCTTGVEAYALDVPALAYQASTNEKFDQDFHRLPNLLSHPNHDIEELIANLKKILAGQLGIPTDEDSGKLISRHLAARKGPLACERIVAVLDKMTAEWSQNGKVGITDRLAGWGWATRRRIKKLIRGYRANMSHNRPEFLRHRYPEISRDDIQERMDRFGQLLGYDESFKVLSLGRRFFKISRCSR